MGSSNVGTSNKAIPGMWDFGKADRNTKWKMKTSGLKLCYKKQHGQTNTVQYPEVYVSEISEAICFFQTSSSKTGVLELLRPISTWSLWNMFCHLDSWKWKPPAPATCMYSENNTTRNNFRNSTSQRFQNCSYVKSEKRWFWDLLFPSGFRNLKTSYCKNCLKACSKPLASSDFFKPAAPDLYSSSLAFFGQGFDYPGPGSKVSTRRCSKGCAQWFLFMNQCTSRHPETFQALKTGQKPEKRIETISKIKTRASRYVDKSNEKQHGQNCCTFLVDVGLSLHLSSKFSIYVPSDCALGIVNPVPQVFIAFLILHACFWFEVKPGFTFLPGKPHAFGCSFVFLDPANSSILE